MALVLEMNLGTAIWMCWVWCLDKLEIRLLMVLSLGNRLTAGCMVKMREIGIR